MKAPTCECGHDFSEHVNPDIEGVSYCKIKKCSCYRYVPEGWNKPASTSEGEVAHTPIDH